MASYVRMIAVALQNSAIMGNGRTGGSKVFRCSTGAIDALTSLALFDATH